MTEETNFGGGAMWFIALLILLFGGGIGGFGNRGPMPNVVTQEQFQEGLNNNLVQSQLQQIALSSANNNYETAQLINGQTNALMQQNNTNLINAIQGFNQINLTIQNQTNVLAQQLQALYSKMDSCCCEIKTEMLQNKYEASQNQLLTARNDISNYNQSQYLLGQFGRFVPWAGSGSQAAAGAATG